MTTQTQTLPKTTMVSCSNWNATNKVSNCEFENQLAEPITINQGDTCQVRNVFLDASRLNSEVIEIAEDTEVEMSFMFYAMIKKTKANLGDMSTDNMNLSNGWIAGITKDFDHQDLPRINDRWNYNLEFDKDPNTDILPIQFTNPLHNFAECAMAGYWRGNYNNEQAIANDPGYVPSQLYDVTLSRWAQTYPYNVVDGLINQYKNDAPAPELCRYNVDNSLPTNNRAVNEPVYLYDTGFNRPYIRTVKYTIPAGIYSREELAVKMTSLMSELKTVPQQVNNENQNRDGDGVINDVYSVTVVDRNLEVPNLTPKRHIIPYQNRLSSGGNPFQASIRFGYLSMTEPDDPDPFDWNEWEASTNQASQQSQDSPLPAPQPEVIADQQTFQRMTPDIVGFVDESPFQTTLEGKKTHPNPQVAWTPLCKSFKIHDYTAGSYPSGAQYDNAQITNQGDNLGVGGVNTGEFNTRKDTLSVYLYDFSGYTLANDPRTNSYNTGMLNEMLFHHWILNVSDQSDAIDSLTGGVFGTNEISITYNDNNNGKFAFNFLHTPIDKAVDTTSGNVPSVVRQVSSRNTNYRFDLDDDPSVVGASVRSACYADRHSGIIFTGLSAQQNGKPFDFWEGILGFKKEDITVTPPKGLFYKNKYFDLTPNETLLTTDEFLSKTTGQIYGISFQQNQQMIQTGLSNELLYVQDWFGEAAPTVEFSDTIYESEQASSLVARNLPASLLSDLGGSILCEITGFSSSNLQSGKDALAVKSIVSLYYLSDNSYISAEQDPYIYYHTSSVSQTISKLRIRFLNPITQRVISDSILGSRNSLFLAITQQIKLFA